MNVITASCRRDLSSDFSLGPLTLSEPLPINSRVVVIVAGYNTTLGEQMKTYHTITAKLRELSFPYEHVVYLEWPASSLKIGFLRAVGRATKTGNLVADLVVELHARGNVVDAQGHSLGCRVLLQAAKTLAKIGEAWSGVHPQFRNMILCAPAVDCDSMALGNEFADSHKGADKIVVAYSGNDGVLKRWYWLAELATWTGALFRGKKPQRALGLVGVCGSAPKTTSVTFTNHVFEHSGYVTSDRYMHMWRNIAVNGEV